MINNNNVLKFQKNPASIALTSFASKLMACPTSSKMEQCYAIPLEIIEEEQHNPGRRNGTSHSGAVDLHNDLISNPKGQIEPVCGRWNKTTGKFDLIYGYTRKWAMLEAKKQGTEVAGSHDWCLWMRVFSGTIHEEIETQMVENANKTPHTPATPQDMVDMMSRFITHGGLDKPGCPFSTLTDTNQKVAAKAWMKGLCPKWGGMKFRGLWNEYQKLDNSSSTSKFKNFRKDDMVDYFLNNNAEGITKTMSPDGLKSGNIVNVAGVSMCIYFSTQPHAFNSASLLLNATRKKFLTDMPDKIIIVQAVNGSNSQRIVGKRSAMCSEIVEWNATCAKSRVVDKIYFMPQTKAETTKLLLSGGFPRIEDF